MLTEEEAKSKPVPARRILRCLPVVRKLAHQGGAPESGYFRIVAYSRDEPRAKIFNARYAKWAPVWVALPDGRRFITEAWVLT